LSECGGIFLKTLLIIWYSRTGACEALAKACAESARIEFDDVGIRLVESGAETPSANGSMVLVERCDQVRFEQLLESDGFIFICPENLGSMAGAMKEFFDRQYYSALGKLNGRGYACIVAAGSDGAGAARQLERIALGWRLNKLAETVIVCTQAQSQEEILAPKILRPDQLRLARDLGQMVAAGLTLGIY
jgi:multimeric flavodoxin WrbA